ncbi:MAG: hypothetical protein IJS52_04545 [Bacilli bacterium]|nr:hypothetical protein [Bacilli bacterium]
MPQVVAELCKVPWGHHRLIIDKRKSIDAALFYIHKIVEGNWSRSVLENYLSANLYEHIVEGDL